MGNPLNPQNQQPNPNMQMAYQQFQQNPMRYLTGLNIPQGMNDPRQIVEYLANTGQVPPQLQAMVNAKLGRR